MKSGYLGIKVFPRRIKPVLYDFVFHPGLGLGIRHGNAEPLQEAGLGHGVGMKLETEGSQPQLGEPILHHLQSRHFRSHEQHLFLSFQSRRNNVGNGLGLSGARRPLQHKAFAGHGRHHRIKLAGIRLNGLTDLPEGHPVVHGLRNLVRAELRETGAFPVGQRGIHGTPAPEHLAVIAEILPHDEFPEGKVPETDGLQDLPALRQHLKNHVLYFIHRHPEFIQGELAQ